MGLHPRKALAQHFLTAKGVLRRILEAAELDQGDVVVEVGPGLGVLTDALAERVRQVVAVELDRDLAAALHRRYEGLPNVRVVVGDGRTVLLEELVRPGVPYKVVANLPYYAATPIIRRFLEAAFPPRLLVFTVQREVAQRMVAQPGAMSLLSVGVQVYGTPRIVAVVPPGAFRPSPGVSSAIVRIDVHAEALVNAADAEAFFALVRAGFSAPRKQLQASLARALKRDAAEVRALLERAGIDPTRRAETLSIEEWRKLYGVYRAA
jgi:16S rRNA (adenine1518-N6/adenine1519-N6)-dimethyltransferase